MFSHIITMDGLLRDPWEVCRKSKKAAGIQEYIYYIYIYINYVVHKLILDTVEINFFEKILYYNPPPQLGITNLKHLGNLVVDFTHSNIYIGEALKIRNT